MAGGVLRNVVQCNWKMYLENINDTVHPMSTHESATEAATCSAWLSSTPTTPSRLLNTEVT